MNIEEINKTWKNGETLPVEVSEQYPIEEQNIIDDLGVNVLLDQAHSCSFASMWMFSKELKKHGFRTSGSHPVLNKVLTPGTLNRVRIPVGDYKPFAWWPVCEFNVIVTQQSSIRDQHYLPEEQKSIVEFVKNGGGLVVLAHASDLWTGKAEWTLNNLMSNFDCELLPENDTFEDEPNHVLKLSDEWEITNYGENNQPVQAQRQFGKGRIVVLGNPKSIYWSPDWATKVRGEKAINQRIHNLVDVVKWASEGKPPVGGTKRLPTDYGAGGIYPEIEERLDGMVVYYTENQFDYIKECVREDFSNISKQLYDWLPSHKPEEPMILLMCSGVGGGWAINEIEPKEVGVISLDVGSVISIFAHEQAHTMAGPDYTDIETPIPKRGEAHAGWFQGKINALYMGDQGPVRNCNSLFEFDKEAKELDLAVCYENDELFEKWGKGKEWVKSWWIWQKLDDRYGSAWFPRWRYVQGVRWANSPGKKLTWDEMIEDMSIAVGEDLFPFFRLIGTTLDKDRLERIEFQGEMIELDPAPIDNTPAETARLEPIRDYTKPLFPNSREQSPGTNY